MFQNKYRSCFQGFSIGRVERDQNFTANLGYFKNEYQIQYILSGERYFLTSGSKCYKLTSGSIAFIDKEQIAKTCLIGGTYHDRILIEIKESEFLWLCENFGIHLRDIFHELHGVFQIDGCAEIKQILEKIEEIMILPNIEKKEAILKIQIMNLLIYSHILEKYRVRSLDSVVVQGSLEKQKRVCMVADYIAEHYMEPMELDDLSRRFYMSKSYMSRIFKEVTNFTVSEYINIFRIAASKQYLLDSELSMTEIANRLGFNSLTYFERVFKQKMSITPRQYRKQKNQKSKKVLDKRPSDDYD